MRGEVRGAVRPRAKILRSWRSSDADWLVRAWADPTVQRWVPLPEVPTREIAAAFVESARQRDHLGLLSRAVLTPEGDLAGAVGVVDLQSGTAELSIWLSPPARGRGLARDAVVLLISELGRFGQVEELLWVADARNGSSVALALRCDFRAQEADLGQWRGLRALISP